MATTRTGERVTNRSGFFQIVVVAGVVVLLLVITFVVAGREADVASETEAAGEEQRPAGAGTIPEGLADREFDGVTGKVDDVDPAAPGIDTIPAVEAAGGPGGAPPLSAVVGPTPDAEVDPSQGDDSAPAVDAVDAVVVPGGDAAEPAIDGLTGPAATEDAPAVAAPEPGTAPATTTETLVVPISPVPDAAESDLDPGATAIVTSPADGAPLVSNEGLVTEEGYQADTLAIPSVEGVPAGRDAATVLTVEPGQDVVTDPDGGGTPFIPTPSGPEGRDGTVITE
jgi:hypothetical protein